MPWKEGTPITNYHTQIQLRKRLKGLISALRDGWMSRKDCTETLQNTILEFWGSMGPDCMVAQG